MTGSEVVPASGHDFYERTSWVGVCQDKVVPKRGYKQRPRQYAAKMEAVQIPVEITKYGNFIDFRTGQAAVTSSTSTTTEEPSTTTFTYPDEIAAQSFEEPTDGIHFMNPTHSSTCQKKETVSYFVFFGYRLASTNVAARLKGIDQSSCVMYCTQNINASGEAIPCYAANYEPADEKCYLYGRRSRTDRNTAHLGADTNFIFADKFCVQTSKDCSAETPYIVYPTKQMHKKIITSYPGMNSVVACVAACIDNRKCKAVTYKTGLCILHGASPASDSSLLVDGTEQTMVIENGCQLTTEYLPSLLSNNIVSGSVTQDVSEWEEWGLCQFAAGGRRMFLSNG
ncbi:PAN domain protein [Teladorsagia circumcincta]|uniref:PAN domain protein n=1 Tax=Teladorsagia circumcincta TaxID=45464 RepID=A0A2G9UVF5_TELCI|nr:PAN domain protein [Teladorsagia circumcincta]